MGNHGEEWSGVWSNDLEQIALQFCEKMEDKSDSNMEVNDVTGLLYRWALESVSTIFLDARLNCLAENRIQTLLG